MTSALLLTSGIEGNKQRVGSKFVVGKTFVDAVIITGRVVHMQHWLILHQTQLPRLNNVVVTAVHVIFNDWQLLITLQDHTHAQMSTTARAGYTMEVTHVPRSYSFFIQ